MYQNLKSLRSRRNIAESAETSENLIRPSLDCSEYFSRMTRKTFH